MSSRFDSAWNDIVPHLGPDLVPAAHHDWMRRFLGFAPREASEFPGFEARLGDTQGATDCALNLNPAAADWLLDSPGALQGVEWDRLRAFLRLWKESGAGSLEDMKCVWLEFDMTEGPLLPNLMFGYWPRNHSPRTRDWLIHQAIPAALGAPLPQATADLLAIGLDACPAATDFQIGLMSARALPAVRLCVFDLPDAELPAYLDAIGWKGDGARLAELVAAFRPHSDFVGLHFDIFGAVFPHVGIEPGFRASAWARQPHLEPRWQGQFDVLQAAGALTDAKRAALNEWIGHTRRADGSVLLRGLSHLKLVLRPDGSSEGKAYFGVAERALVREEQEVRDARVA